MRSIYLLRHAKSSWADPTLADHERPLAPRGRRDAKRIAAHLIQLGIAPDLVLCSTAVRTRETLELILPALHEAPVELEAALYAAWAETLLERLRAVPDERRSVMLIGHNPGLEDLALGLASTGPERDRIAEKFPTAALATLTTPAATWKELSPGGAVLTAYVVPRQLAD